MDKTQFLSGFAILLGLYNIWSARNTGGRWRWIGVAMIVFGIGLFVIDTFVLKIVP